MVMIKRCDRCHGDFNISSPKPGKVLPQRVSIPSIEKHVYHYEETLNIKEYDLCQDCIAALNEWLEPLPKVK